MDFFAHHKFEKSISCVSFVKLVFAGIQYFRYFNRSTLSRIGLINRSGGSENGPSSASLSGDICRVGATFGPCRCKRRSTVDQVGPALLGTHRSQRRICVRAVLERALRTPLAKACRVSSWLSFLQSASQTEEPRSFTLVLSSFFDCVFLIGDSTTHKIA